MKKQVLFIVLLMLPLLAHADDSGSCGDNVTYTYKSSTHTMTISGSGPMKDYGVSQFRSPWSSYMKDIRKLIIESGVTTVSTWSFYNATSLMSVTLPEGITSIGGAAFMDCSAITKMTLPSTVTIIGEIAFFGCSSMKTINIPDGVTEIGKEAFYVCSNLTSIDIPGSVKTIGKNAFYNCAKMTSVTLHEGLEFIGERAFTSCESLKSIVIPNSVTSIEQHTFAFCHNLESITLPDNLTAIGKDAFLWCRALQEIVIPATVEVIYSEAFVNSGLKKIKVLAVEPPIAFDDAFSDYNIPLYVPDESLSKYQTTEPWNKFTSIKKVSEEGQADIDPDLQVSKEALKNSITEATTYYNSIKDNYAEIAATLKTAIDAAQAVADKTDATKTEVDNAKTTLDTALQTAKDAKAAADQLAANKAAFEAYKTEQKTAADNKALSGDSQACLDLISAAKTAIDNLPYDESKSLEQNKAAVDAILTKLEADLAAQREVDAALKSLQESRDALMNSIIEATDYYNSIKDNNPEIAATLKTAIDAAQAVYDNASSTKSEVDTAKTTLDAAVDAAKSSVTGISVIHIGDSRKTAYTLDGRKIDGTPTKKGIYIVNGRKVVMK